MPNFTGFAPGKNQNRPVQPLRPKHENRSAAGRLLQKNLTNTAWHSLSIRFYRNTQ